MTRAACKIHNIYFDLGSKQVAYYDSVLCSFPTIRCTNCCLLVPQSVKRCERCRDYRKKLNSMLSRLRRKGNTLDPTAVDSHTNYRFLSKLEKEKRMQQLHKTAKVHAHAHAYTY